jgi:hypothetical protein
MSVAKEKLERNLPTLAVLLCVATGDYISLLRYLRLFI